MPFPTPVLALGFLGRRGRNRTNTFGVPGEAGGAARAWWRRGETELLPPGYHLYCFTLRFDPSALGNITGFHPDFSCASVASVAERAEVDDMRGYGKRFATRLEVLLQVDNDGLVTLKIRRLGTQWLRVSWLGSYQRVEALRRLLLIRVGVDRGHADSFRY